MIASHTGDFGRVAAVVQHVEHLVLWETAPIRVQRYEHCVGERGDNTVSRLDTRSSLVFFCFVFFGRERAEEGKKRWGLSVRVGRTGFAVPQIGHPQIFMCGIDKRGGDLEAEPGLLVVRPAAAAPAADGKMVHNRLDLLVRAVGQRIEGTTQARLS
ncbi:hypothetical protein BJV74DRAFT_275065 [Russula compacta]|nr:hypothetical protein BJV74DRAFT_275065 [Russula compacta]